MAAKRQHQLRRHRIITDAELLEEEGEEGEKDDSSDDDSVAGVGAGGEEDLTQREIKWSSLPDGLTVSAKPLVLDDSLCGKNIYMRWDAPHGWLLGTISVKFDQSTPRLVQKFNYRVKWFDGWENHKLTLDNYLSGSSAPYQSWVLIEKDSGASGS